MESSFEINSKLHLTNYISKHSIAAKLIPTKNIPKHARIAKTLIWNCDNENFIIVIDIDKFVDKSKLSRLFNNRAIKMVSSDKAEALTGQLIGY